MLRENRNRSDVRKAILLLQNKLTPAACENENIWADVRKIGVGLFGVLDAGRIAVEINVPPFKKRPMGLIANEHDRKFLCHNGRLNPRLNIDPEKVFKKVVAKLKTFNWRVVLKNAKASSPV